MLVWWHGRLQRCGDESAAGRRLPELGPLTDRVHHQKTGGWRETPTHYHDFHTNNRKNTADTTTHEEDHTQAPASAQGHQDDPNYSDQHDYNDYDLNDGEVHS